MTSINVKTAKTAELVAFYNEHAERRVTKFSDRKTAERRVQQLIDHLDHEASERRTGDRRTQNVVEPTTEGENMTDVTPAAVEGDDQLVEEFGHAECPSCSVHLSNGVMTFDWLAAEKGSHAKAVEVQKHEFSCMGCGAEWGKEITANTARSEGVAKSWLDPEVKAKRAQRNGVRVDGVEYKSVTKAFEALELPLKMHVKFRMELKAAGKLEEFGHTWEII